MARVKSSPSLFDSRETPAMESSHLGLQTIHNLPEQLQQLFRQEGKQLRDMLSIHLRDVIRDELQTLPTRRRTSTTSVPREPDLSACFLAARPKGSRSKSTATSDGGEADMSSRRESLAKLHPISLSQNFATPMHGVMPSHEDRLLPGTVPVDSTQDTPHTLKTSESWTSSEAELPAAAESSVESRTSKLRITLSSICRELVEHFYFHCTICSCVIFNSLVIGVQTDHHVRNVGDPTPPAFIIVEVAFCLIFFSDLVLRLIAYGGRFFHRQEWRWNNLDFVVVCMQVLDLVSQPLLKEQEQANAASGNFNILRILRVLRLLRIVRLLRVFRYFNELRTMVASIASSCRSLLWTILLVLLLIYVVGVYITNLVADHWESLENDAVRQYYGSLLVTLLSLFQGMTGGVDWNDLAMPLMQEISPLMGIVFSLYITFAVLCMMNIITGIFVESALLTANADKERDLRAQLEKLFNNLDVDANGMLTWQEFMMVLQSSEAKQTLTSAGVDFENATNLFILLDVDDSGEISAEELIQGCLKMRGPAKAMDVSGLMYFNKRITAWWAARLDTIDDDLDRIATCIPDLKAPCASRPRRVSRRPIATWSDMKAESEKKMVNMQITLPSKDVVD